MPPSTGTPRHTRAERASIRVLYAAGITQRALAQAFGGSVSTVGRVIYNEQSSVVDDTSEDRSIARKAKLLKFRELETVAAKIHPKQLAARRPTRAASSGPASARAPRAQAARVTKTETDDEYKYAPSSTGSECESESAVFTDDTGDSSSESNSETSDSESTKSIASEVVPADANPDFLLSFLTRISLPGLYAPLTAANVGRADLLRLASPDITDAMRYAYVGQLTAQANIAEFGISQRVWFVEHAKQLSQSEENL
ncbi:hypothetical protein MIND_00408900 [Mycena indigotica]|uniref:Uncharacterized protein n=1 Tax=Mycena indigotica TaxID=2126181 RepID=A0A8H6SVE3_9AGAR|nr:uncharacterized protein MIND_00408900 [Mycena indigotica]KAF7306186.1 hypothetical protein MIND_00408900 [Mycena indigotica]